MVEMVWRSIPFDFIIMCRKSERRSLSYYTYFIIRFFIYELLTLFIRIPVYQINPFLKFSKIVNRKPEFYKRLN